MNQEIHNPDQLHPDKFGRPETWRPLTKDEIDFPPLNCEVYDVVTGRWDTCYNDPFNPLYYENTYRTDCALKSRLERLEDIKQVTLKRFSKDINWALSRFDGTGIGDFFVIDFLNHIGFNNRRSIAKFSLNSNRYEQEFVEGSWSIFGGQKLPYYVNCINGAVVKSDEFNESVRKNIVIEIDAFFAKKAAELCQNSKKLTSPPERLPGVD